MIEFLIVFAAGYIFGFISYMIVRSIKRPYDGVMQISDVDEGKKMFSLELNRDPMDLEDREEVVFQVRVSEGSRKEN